REVSAGESGRSVRADDEREGGVSRRPYDVTARNGRTKDAAYETLLHGAGRTRNGAKAREGIYRGQSEASRGARMEASANRRRCVMTRRLRWLWVTPAFLAVVALSCGTAGAADKTKVDRATKRVEQGAKQVSQGRVGPGFKEMFTGIGRTIV